MSTPAALKTEAMRIKDRQYTRKCREKNRANGRCIQCGAARPLIRLIDTICRVCWFKHMALLHTKSRTNGPLLSDIYDAQGERCAYTGEQLVPGVNASLDHKTPVSRGGTHERRNLQWVTKRINSMKSDLTHEEFAALCQMIANRRSRREAADAVA